jgi:hypothetical protein
MTLHVTFNPWEYQTLFIGVVVRQLVRLRASDRLIGCIVRKEFNDIVKFYDCFLSHTQGGVYHTTHSDHEYDQSRVRILASKLETDD